jgi:hypothetical protein
MTSPDAAAFKTSKKLPARYGAFLTPLVISVLMSCIVSGVSTAKSLGFVESFLAAWMSAWMASWLVASDGDARDVLRHHANVIDAAAATGIKRVIFTSILDIEETSRFYYTPVYRDAERRLTESGLNCTILRCSLYSDLLLSHWIAPREPQGNFAFPWGRHALRLFPGRMLPRRPPR